MSRILICGEGVNEIGRRDWLKREGVFLVREGWLQPMVARLRSSQGDVEAMKLSQLITFPGREVRALDGLARKAQIAKFKAGSEGYSGVVFATDVDSVDPRDHAEKQARILEGYDTIDNGVTGVACVPMATSEAWLMTDQSAWEALGAEAFGEWPARPEQCWGRPHDPQSNHPKMVFNRICSDNDIPPTSDTRAELAQSIALGALRVRAPVSFPPFEQQATAL